ncbi:hypothetical protein [Mycolicibacterium sp.]|uniref:hypothetical protein n=1 Tax=Mycolicibacterium sp. TaxID=2320850 RepID=UPI0035608A7F
MAETYRNARAIAGTTATTVITGATGGATLVRSITLHNSTSTPRTVDVWWTDDSAGDARTDIVTTLGLVEGAPWEIPGPLILEDGDALVVEADAAAAVHVTVAAVEVT